MDISKERFVLFMALLVLGSASICNSLCIKRQRAEIEQLKKAVLISTNTPAVRGSE